MMVHIPVSHVSINRHWRGSVSCCDFRPKGIMVSYGTRRKHRILLVHLFAKALGPSKSKVRHNILLRWENFPDVTRTFLELAGTPSNISEENLCTIKRFVILICDRTSHFSKEVTIWYLFQVNDARKYLFAKKKGEGWKAFHPLVTLWNNTRSAPHIKEEDTCGDRQPPAILFFLNHQIRAGSLEEKSSWNHNGLRLTSSGCHLQRTGSLLAVIFGVWVLASFAGSMVAIPVQTGVTGLIITVTFLFVPLIVILAAYGKIFRIARAHAHGRGVSSFKKDLRISITVAVVTGLFIICWTPFFGINFAFGLCSSSSIGCEVLNKIPPTFIARIIK
ncbi:unnamed protein product [Porites lobata]|uniref:G-protein coupled receptors family 1 profile domain-containing protein n=1 Tax=Porites lobata TaxID=104759 RepID=A0ABN8PQ53_9CNID|nr:unnamed protein product [Porites lobata]